MREADTLKLQHQDQFPCLPVHEGVPYVKPLPATPNSTKGFDFGAVHLKLMDSGRENKEWYFFLLVTGLTPSNLMEMKRKVGENEAKLLTLQAVCDATFSSHLQNLLASEQKVLELSVQCGAHSVRLWFRSSWLILGSNRPNGHAYQSQWTGACSASE